MSLMHYTARLLLCAYPKHTPSNLKSPIDNFIKGIPDAFWEQTAAQGIVTISIPDNAKSIKVATKRFEQTRIFEWFEVLENGLPPQTSMA